MAAPLPDLTPQQQTFVEEYAKDRNGVRAALAAGLSPTYFGANAAARALLQNPSIRAALKVVFGVQARRLKMEPPDVLREWAVLARSDLDDYEVTADGRVTTRPGVPRSALRAVKRVKQTRTERLTGRGDNQELTVEVRTEIELHPKEGPLAKLDERLHGVLPGEKKAEIPVDVATRILAEYRARLEPGGRDAAPGGDPVVPEPGAAEPGVHQPGG